MLLLLVSLVIVSKNFALSTKNVAGNADNHTKNGSGSTASQVKPLPSNDIITEGNPGLTETIQSSDSVNIQTEGSEFGENGLTEGNHGSKEHCSFRMEKPKMPKFYGDVIEYFIFKAVFKHLVETRYSKRDSITLLRSCLQGKPQELIKGIVQDYDAAWEYLDSIYGDPRLVADTIIQDITKFKTLRDSEEARFCDLVHLVRRSFNGSRR